MNKNNIYPFAAIVGREELKTALILNAVNQGLAGVLIRGEKGAAKSTAVRALAASFSVSSVAIGDLNADTSVNAIKRRINE